jgi:hypothetical protein
MKTDTAAEFLIKKLNEQREMIKEFLVGSKEMSVNDYIRMRGNVQGLDHAIQLITDLAKDVEESNE